MSAFLITGFKSCGKSTVGRLLAQRLDCAFHDLDTLIEGLWEQETGESLPFRAVYRKAGGGRFREMERQAATQAAAASGKEPIVLALGGGALMDPETRRVLQGLGRVVYVKVPFEVILERIRRGGYPAFLKSDDPEKELRDLYQQRASVYEECADLVVDAGDQNPVQVCSLIFEALERARG